MPEEKTTTRTTITRTTTTKTPDTKPVPRRGWIDPVPAKPGSWEEGQRKKTGY